MPRPLAALVLILLLAHASAFQIVEFCPDPYLPGDADEYVVLEGAGPAEDLLVSDGEGGFRFPKGYMFAGRVVVAREGVAYRRTHGKDPDIELFDTSPDIRDAIRAGRFQMSNSGDELRLYIGGELVQRIEWPGQVRAREGQVHFLANETWDPRPLFIGQSRFIPAEFGNATITAFASPDSASPVFMRVVGDARHQLLVNVYLFTQYEMAEALANAKRRGVEVQVLLEGSPVGGMPREALTIAGCMNASGIPVFLMKGPEEARERYRYDHAKYMVVDGRGVFITSENFDPNGFPPAGARGNRGWGVYILSEGAANYFMNVFFADLHGYDVVPLSIGSGDIPVHAEEPYAVEFPAEEFGGARVVPVLAPDTSELVTELLRSAKTSIEIEQAYIRNWSGEDPNPYLEAAIGAARRGVRVRILLDSYWFNTEGREDNDEMVAYLNEIAAREGIPLEARLARLTSADPEKIHNKGVIVDNRSVLISSINWNENSPLYNREAGVIIEHEGVAAYFLRVFSDDWEAAGNTGSATASNPGAAGTIRLCVAGAILFVLACIYLYRRRRF